MKILILLSLIALHGLNAQNCCQLSEPIPPKEDLSLKEAFEKYKIVDDFLPEAPEDLFVGRHFEFDIKPGTILSPLATLTPLALSYPNGKEGVKYTAVLLDIDAPTRVGNKTAYINGIFMNCPNNDLYNGDVVVPFTPAVPSFNTGYQRYVGLIYKQNGAMDIDNKDLLMLARNRNSFSAVDFGSQFGLGKPVAGNFFLSTLSECSSR